MLGGEIDFNAFSLGVVPKNLGDRWRLRFWLESNGLVVEDSGSCFWIIKLFEIIGIDSIGSGDEMRELVKKQERGG